MFEELVDAALAARGDAAAVRGWARVENAACARRLSASVEILDRLIAADGSADREQWCYDNWDAAAAEVGAAQNVSLGVASHQLLVGVDLRDRMPRMAEVFAAGAISYRLVEIVLARTRLVRDPEVMAKIDAEVAAQIAGWTTLSKTKAQNAIDYWIDRYDPAAVRRTETSSRGRCVDVHISTDGSGTANLEATLLATDGAALDERLDAMAAAVCERDPRTLDQRRSDALGALGHGEQVLGCACGSVECPAAQETANTVVIHVVASQDSLDDDTQAQLDGHAVPEPTPPTNPEAGPATGPEVDPVTDTVTDTVTDSVTRPARPEAGPGFLLGGAILPARLLAAKIAARATLRPVIHPGDSPPERRYRPSAALAWFVRCRDLTCRFPGCDEPAHRCDLDHTLAYPHGSTQASNLACLCRKHHLLKTFWSWRATQHPDGTLEWVSPSGQTYTTQPGSRLLFPALCRPTAPVVVIDHTANPVDETTRALKMPRRGRTRAQDRANAIEAERQANQPDADERNKPPPF